LESTFESGGICQRRQENGEEKKADVGKITREVKEKTSGERTFENIQEKSFQKRKNKKEVSGRFRSEGDTRGA